MSPMTRIGVVGAGRVGAVLAAALRAAGHEIVAVAGESAASRTRIETLLPGRPGRQADRRVAVLRPAAAHRARRHAVERGHDAGRLRRDPPGPAGRAHLRQARPRGAGPGRRGGRRDPRDAPGDDVHRHPRRRRPAARLRVRGDRRPTAPARSPARWSPTSAAASCGSPEDRARSTTRASRTARTTSSPWSPRRWTCSASPAPTDPAATLRPLLTAALDNALTYGDAALTGPIVRGDVETVRAHLAEIAPHLARHAGVVRRAGPRHREPGGRRRPAAADPGRQARRHPQRRAGDGRTPADRGARRAPPRDRARDARRPVPRGARRGAPARTRGRAGRRPGADDGCAARGHAALMREARRARPATPSWCRSS